jgi:multiple sugar transport system ATP-binding protein
LQAWLERELILGVRPEDLRPCDAASAALHATLEVVEPIGNEVFLNLRYGEQALVARVPPRELPAPGVALPFALAPGRLHFFDADTGARIG